MMKSVPYFIVRHLNHYSERFPEVWGKVELLFLLEFPTTYVAELVSA